MRIRPLVWLSGGRINWRTIQIIQDAGYADAYRIRHPGEPGLTLPTSRPHVRLDYVFVPQHDIDRLLACDVVRDAAAPAASDHFPVVADFRLDGPDR
jgi:endonuclease/exonuclease/phosphatase family metal-dependent hydrolase